MDLMKTGQFIAESRKNCGITQKELADIIGVTDKAVSRWETGKGFPDVSVLKELSEALDVSITEIVNGEKTPAENIAEKSDSAVMETLAYIRQMTEKAFMIIVLIAGILIMLSPLFLAVRSGAPWLFILGAAGIVLTATALFFLLRKKRPKKHKLLTRTAAEIISLSALVVAVVLEALPFGAVMYFMAGPEETIVKTYSYFSMTPFGYGNPLPLLTGVLTVAVTVLSAVSLFKKSGGSPRNVAFICTVVTFVFSLLPMIIHGKAALIQLGISVMLGASLFFQAYAARRTNSN